MAQVSPSIDSDRSQEERLLGEELHGALCRWKESNPQSEAHTIPSPIPGAGSLNELVDLVKQISLETSLKLEVLHRFIALGFLSRSEHFVKLTEELEYCADGLKHNNIMCTDGLKPDTNLCAASRQASSLAHKICRFGCEWLHEYSSISETFVLFRALLELCSEIRECSIEQEHIGPLLHGFCRCESNLNSHVQDVIIQMITKQAPILLKRIMSEVHKVNAVEDPKWWAFSEIFRSSWARATLNILVGAYTVASHVLASLQTTWWTMRVLERGIIINASDTSNVTTSRLVDVHLPTEIQFKILEDTLSAKQIRAFPPQDFNWDNAFKTARSVWCSRGCPYEFEGPRRFWSPFEWVREDYLCKIEGKEHSEVCKGTYPFATPSQISYAEDECPADPANIWAIIRELERGRDGFSGDESDVSEGDEEESDDNDDKVEEPLFE